MDGPKLPPPTVHLSDHQVKQVKDDSRKPKCPYCGLDPLKVHIDDEANDLGNGVYLMTRTTICQGCRAPLPVVVLGTKKSALADLTTPLPPQFKM